MLRSENALNPKEADQLIAKGKAPAGMRVSGVLDYSARSGRSAPKSLPWGMRVDVLDLSGTDIETLPRGLTTYELILSGTRVFSLPEDLKVESRLDLSSCVYLDSLPENLAVGTLNLRGCTSLRSLPENLDVWFLNLSGCWAFSGWPRSARIRSGQLQLRGCTAIARLPEYLSRLSALNVCDCPNLAELPEELTVTGWLDLGRSGLKNESQLPPGLRNTQLRWAGVNIDKRIAFHPETITVDEVLGERNAERRRMLLDRYGYGKFLTDANAEIVDNDTDPGGPRQLMRLRMERDEDLVALSCFCPSTGRQYMIRVPPTTPTCHHAAAWIAGFDDPDDYHPVLET